MYCKKRSQLIGIENDISLSSGFIGIGNEDLSFFFFLDGVRYANKS